MEISFLSMLHAFLHSSTEVGALDECLVRDKLAGAPELQAWLREHPCLPNVEMLKSEEGVTQRTSWAEFLTGRDGLRYNGDGFELTACEENTAALFRDVAGLPPAAAKSAQAVCAHFSAPGRVWSCERSESSDGSGLRTPEVAYSLEGAPRLLWRTTQRFEGETRMNSHSHVFTANARGLGGGANTPHPQGEAYEPEEWPAEFAW